MQKIKKNIPNAITACNLLCGCLAIVWALNGDLHLAVYYIFAAAIFDFFDGFVARLLKVQSPIGVQLDSLSDMVSFGVAPATMLYSMLSELQTGLLLELPEFLPFAAFLIAVFSALRLAKFNIDERQTSSFIGLPTPACAIFICGLVYFDLFTAAGYFVLLALIPVLCTLLVCELPMFSLKIKKTGNPFLKAYGLQVILLVSSLIFIAFWQLKGLSPAIGLYVLLSGGAYLLKIK